MIKTHGTGNAIEDPLELWLTYLASSFGKDNNQDQFCIMSSVKSNMDHLELGFLSKHVRASPEETCSSLEETSDSYSRWFVVADLSA